MEELQARRAEVARAQPHVTQLLPRRLVELQQHLAALSRPPHSRFHMPAAELHALAQERFGMGEDMARLVLGLLHDWGVVHVLPGGEQVVLADGRAGVRDHGAPAGAGGAGRRGQRGLAGAQLQSDGMGAVCGSTRSSFSRNSWGSKARSHSSHAFLACSSFAGSSRQKQSRKAPETRSTPTWRCCAGHWSTGLPTSQFVHVV
jgi:hypothetical protein